MDRADSTKNLATKPFVIGRKNWLFANTPNGASASSLIYSVIQTAIANDLKPLSYLEYVFGQIQMSWDLQTEDLLPGQRRYQNAVKTRSLHPASEFIILGMKAFENASLS